MAAAERSPAADLLRARILAGDAGAGRAQGASARRLAPGGDFGLAGRLRLDGVAGLDRLLPAQPGASHRPAPGGGPAVAEAPGLGSEQLGPAAPRRRRSSAAPAGRRGPPLLPPGGALTLLAPALLLRLLQLPQPLAPGAGALGAGAAGAGLGRGAAGAGAADCPRQGPALVDHPLALLWAASARAAGAGRRAGELSALAAAPAPRARRRSRRPPGPALGQRRAAGSEAGRARGAPPARLRGCAPRGWGPRGWPPRGGGRARAATPPRPFPRWRGRSHPERGRRPSRQRRRGLARPRGRAAGLAGLGPALAAQPPRGAPGGQGSGRSQPGSAPRSPAAARRPRRRGGQRARPRRGGQAGEGLPAPGPAPGRPSGPGRAAGGPGAGPPRQRPSSGGSSTAALSSLAAQSRSDPERGRVASGAAASPRPRGRAAGLAGLGPALAAQPPRGPAPGGQGSGRGQPGSAPGSPAAARRPRRRGGRRRGRGRPPPALGRARAGEGLPAPGPAPGRPRGGRRARAQPRGPLAPPSSLPAAPAAAAPAGPAAESLSERPPRFLVEATSVKQQNNVTRGRRTCPKKTSIGRGRNQIVTSPEKCNNATNCGSCRFFAGERSSCPREQTFWLRAQNLATAVTPSHICCTHRTKVTMAQDIDHKTQTCFPKQALHWFTNKFKGSLLLVLQY